MKQKTRRKGFCAVLAAVLAAGAVSGCSAQLKKTNDDSIVEISIGGWPEQDSDVSYARYEDWLKRYNELYPNVKVEKDSWAYSYDTFLAKAASNMLPSVYTTFFTEIKKIQSAGYAADITKQVEDYHYLENLNEDLVSICKNDGKFYTVPKSAYALCLVANKSLFEEIGQVDEDGYAVLPQTIEELTETAVKIKEKTGKIGFIMPSMQKQGGWIFSNLAWEFGVEFIKQEGDSYKAAFDSQEMRDALQWLYDMKWKYEVLGDNAFVDANEVVKVFGSGNGAMYVGQPTEGKIKTMIHGYQFDKDNLVLGQVPGGPGGRYSLIGGDVWVLNNNLDEAQKNAVFDWLDLTGSGPELNEDSLDSIDRYYKDLNQLGSVVGYTGLEIWKSGPICDAYDEARKKYCNVDVNNFREYDSFDSTTLKSEEPVHCQDLYDVLDGLVQEVLSNQNVDVAAIIKTAADNFQRNFLDE